ncbi:hypothetical protein LWE61_07860 [Sphingobium sufflavum]|uniref:hypothetical protein n=1 Tax=Sphingobium sufflavum TaxID=1129547 RepID=UPI001F34723E|nr:hypothetical protein [Sphingobium sufflavum]MCE7796476.1 hypothetical protein [Sphingobium sufflavum]
MTGSDHTAPRQILDPSRIDDLGEAIIALTRELWVVSDRQMVLEAVLAEAGVPVERIDRYQPDEAMAARLTARRQQLLDTILEALRAR